MADIIHIQLMDTFNIYVNNRKVINLVGKSRKGVSLMAYLILFEGQSVPNYRILSALWSEEKSTNPENAMKTLISRFRTMLNEISPELGKCIVADRGSYHWETVPGMTVDVFRIEELFEQLNNSDIHFKTRAELTSELIKIYPGDLLQNFGQNEWALAKATALHNKYMSAIYAYIDALKEQEDYQEIASVCRSALDVDSFDDRLHMELMTALINTGRTSDALVQYKHVVQMNYRYLGVQPSDDMQEFYKQIVRAGKTLEFNLEAIRKELRESDEYRGAFICEYAVFKEIYNLQMRNLERLGSTMFLGVVMIGNPDDPDVDTIKQNSVMNGLMEIMQANLRKGDTITHFAPTIIALLLPTVNYTTGNMVMERIKRLFYRKYPNSNITFNYRIGPLGNEALLEKSENSL